jgi:hypothetical protein
MLSQGSTHQVVQHPPLAGEEPRQAAEVLRQREIRPGGQRVGRFAHAHEEQQRNRQHGKRDQVQQGIACRARQRLEDRLDRYAHADAGGRGQNEPQRPQGRAPLGRDGLGHDLLPGG